MSTRNLLMAAGALLVTAQPAAAALFVSGDSNILGDQLDHPGNTRFLLNLAGDGIVVLHRSEFGSYITTDISFVLGNAGVPHFEIAVAPVTEADLVGASLYISYTRAGWTAEEAALLSSFARTGGHVLLLGEWAWQDERIAINALAEAMGSDLALDGSGGDLGQTASIVTDNAFTIGTDGLRYAGPTGVAGGTPLFAMENTGSAFVAFDSFAAVPEPSTWVVLIAGFGAVGAMLRRRREFHHSQPAK